VNEIHFKRNTRVKEKDWDVSARVNRA
jgi:hypothetical protein